ncbi:hypothetical protein DFH27DRAFT_369782 [Peziza echinospora]|nr:hypothetical protein DFH27DRAFT_369782 [Peziza echinospora]
MAPLRPRALPPVAQAGLTAAAALRALNGPAAFPKGHFTRHVPAISRWFVPPGAGGSSVWTVSPTLIRDCPPVMVPVEATIAAGQPHFTQSHLPLPLFLEYLSQPRPQPSALPALYLAQYPLDAGSPLTAAFTPPPPPLSSATGQAPSPTLWLGTSTTATSPLHRDPLANVFVHLAGGKVVRMFSPESGERILGRLLGAHVAKKKIRGQEMMAGEERTKVDEYVWQENAEPESEDEAGYEVTVGSGDGVYIPAGWWHAVRAVHEVDEKTGVEGVCASVCLVTKIA